MTTELKNDSRKRVNLTNGTLVNLQLVISDIASFNRYVIREHGSTMQGEDIFGKSPVASNVANCVYDELSGWLDNPNILGLTILGISFDENKIEEEAINVSTEEEDVPVTTNLFNVIKLIGELASKDHTVEATLGGAEAQLTALREKARTLLKNLPQIESD